MALTQEQVIEALKSVYDPEIPVNIVDLGLGYEVKLHPAMQVASALAPAAAEGDALPQDVDVLMTLTSPGCPSHVTIGDSVKRTIEALPGAQTASVQFIWEPQWGPERISAEGKVKLGIEV